MKNNLRPLKFQLRPVLKIRFRKLDDTDTCCFRSSSASIGLKTTTLIGRVARYTPSSTYVLRLDSWQNTPRPNF